MFVGVLKAIKGGKIEVEQKKSFLPDIHRVNMGLRGLGCGQYKRTTFEGFLCIFLKILAKDMGKPLVPAVPRHLGHLGHPIVPWADDIKAGSAISLIDRIPSPPLATGRVL